MNILYLSLLFTFISLNFLSEAHKNNRANSNSAKNKEVDKNAKNRFPRVHFNQEQRAQLRENCRQKGLDWCRQQTAEARRFRKQLKQNMKTATKKMLDVSSEEAEERVEKHLQKIHSAKRAIMKAIGLEDIEPSENGLWEGDMKLNEEQADRIVAKAEKSSDLAYLNEFVNKIRRRKRNGMNFDNLPDYKWPGGKVPFYISQYFTGVQQQMIRDGLKAIQAKTCIHFQEINYTYNSPYIYYRQTKQDGICGYSPLGMQKDVNMIDLNFDASSTAWMRRCIQHETLHSLGVKHTQSRFDRDNYVELDMNNIDPQNVYNFAKVDPAQYSSYGVDYEGKSMMHYVFDAFSINGKPTIVPKLSTNLNNIDLGSNMEISDYDAQLLNHMYSCPLPGSPNNNIDNNNNSTVNSNNITNKESSCKDNESYCEYWARYGYCPSIKNDCPKSCGAC